MDKNKTHIFPWHRSSKGARALAKALGIRMIRRGGSKYVGGSTKLVINYGSSDLPATIKRSQVLNADISVAVNKLTFFQAMEGKARIPKFTTRKQDVLEWLKKNPEAEIVGRTRLSGRGGVDIHFSTSYNTLEEFLELPCRLYTRYKPKKEEYRVHVFNGKVIDIQRKVLAKEDMNGVPVDPKKVDFKVRTHKNGFIFQRQNISPPEDVSTQALKAMEASGLDFGGVDVIWNEHDSKAYVLEINTAPGLEGTTVESYAEAIRNL